MDKNGKNTEVVLTNNGAQQHSKKQSIMKDHNSKASFGSYRGGSQSSMQQQRFQKQQNSNLQTENLQLVSTPNDTPKDNPYNLQNP